MSSQPQRNFRWVIVALLFAATTINYLDRQVLSLLKPTLEQTFGWSESSYAQIVLAFTLTYGLSTLLAGYLIDRIGTKLGFAVSIVVWSLATIAHGLVRSTVGFAMARALLGLGEAGNFPASIKTVAEWFSARERALAVGLFNAGSNVGAIVAPVLVPWLALVGGWPFAFFVTGALGFAWLLAWLLLYRSPSIDRMVLTNDSVILPVAPSTQAVWKQRSTWAFVLGKLLTDPVWWFFLFWLPAYLSDVFGLDLKKMGSPLVIIYCAAAVGSIAGGWLSSALIRRGHSPIAARLRAMLLFALCVVPIVFLGNTSALSSVVTILGLAVAAHQAWSANLFAVVADQFDQRVVSRVVGMGTMAGTLGGAAFPLLVGAILDHYKAIQSPATGYSIIFYIGGAAYLVAWLLLRVLVPLSPKAL